MRGFGHFRPRRTPRLLAAFAVLLTVAGALAVWQPARPAAADLTAVACPRVSTRYAVGTNGTILALKR